VPSSLEELRQINQQRIHMLRQPIMRYNWNQETDYVEEGMNKRKLLEKALSGSKNIHFYDLELGD
jgi:hypothetical protein